jgi:hypothetical protein
VRAAAVSFDGAFLLSAGGDGTLYLQVRASLGLGL